MKGPCAGLRGRGLTFIWGQGEEKRPEGRDGTGGTGHEDGGGGHDRVSMGNSMSLENQATFGKWQVAAWLCCFAGSGVKMRVRVRDIRRFGGACTLTLGHRHRSLSVSLTWALAGPLHTESQSWENTCFLRFSSEGHRKDAAPFSFLVSGHRDLPTETLRSAVHPLRCLVSLCLVSRSVLLVTTLQAGLKSCMVAAVFLWNSCPAMSPCSSHSAMVTWPGTYCPASGKRGT